MSQYKIATLAGVVGCAIAIAISSTPALAGKPRKNADPPCTVSGTTVTATGLPTGVVLNFMVSDASGTTGWVLGISDNGLWSVQVPAPNGPTTYEFVSKTWGPNGSKYNVYSSCSTS